MFTLESLNYLIMRKLVTNCNDLFNVGHPKNHRSVVILDRLCSPSAMSVLLGSTPFPINEPPDFYLGTLFTTETTIFLPRRNEFLRQSTHSIIGN